MAERTFPPTTDRNSNSNSPGKQQQQQQTQLDNRYESVLSAENDRLRAELLELRRQMRQMVEIERRKQQHDYSIHDESSKSNFMSHNHQTQEKQQQQKNNVLLELPVTLRTCSSSSNSCTNKNQKDHLSVSTDDGRETIEPLDIEAHQSAAGLHHRSTNVTATIDTTNTTTSSSLKTRRTENLTDYSSSSIDDIDDDDIDDDVDDPMAEAQVLIGGGDSHCRSHKNTDTLDGNDNRRQQQQMTFCQSLTDRAGWLIGLLILQSLSSFILARNESLLQRHGVIIQFLTMLVGAGGNAGNQASVGVIRGIAVGSISSSNKWKVLRREFSMGLALSIILGFAGFVRAKAFSIPWMETITITVCLFMIVIISVVVGAMLPLCMQFVGIDPAHSSTTIQVIMDITGVFITVSISTLLLDSDFHDWFGIAFSLDGETR